MLLFDPLTILAALAMALILDALVGEPDWAWRRLPHPAVVMGRAIAWCDRNANRAEIGESWRRALGLASILSLCTCTFAIGYVLSVIPGGAVVSAIGGAILIAQRSLCDHVSAVADGLDVSVSAGREAVAMIVGRNPQSLDEAGVARAAIESGAENFSDGVAAPVFWFLVAGLPGIATYKMLNTADSMIGHRTPRHLAFGWASARLDDVANLIPARISGVLIAAVGRLRPGMRAMVRDAGRHKSPNAGWPEAAMAGSLGLALAGPRVYGETRVEDHWMNDGGRSRADSADIRSAVRLLWRAWAVIVSATLVAAISLAVGRFG